jgi:serine/threonine protein kinase
MMQAAGTSEIGKLLSYCAVLPSRGQPPLTGHPSKKRKNCIVIILAMYNFSVFENREKMVLVMEYAAGGELYDFLSERKVLPEEEARRIFRQIATAVFYCHKVSFFMSFNNRMKVNLQNTILHLQ